MRDERRSTTRQSFTGLQRERERERATEGSNARTNKRQSKRGVRDQGTTNHACTAHRAPRTAHAPRKVSRSGHKESHRPGTPTSCSAAQWCHRRASTTCAPACGVMHHEVPRRAADWTHPRGRHAQSSHRRRPTTKRCLGVDERESTGQIANKRPAPAKAQEPGDGECQGALVTSSGGKLPSTR